jgi:carbon storage regulator CsrA
MTQDYQSVVTIDLTTQLSINENVKVKIVATQHNRTVKLAFTAPHEVLILRSELFRRRAMRRRAGPAGDPSV